MNSQFKQRLVGALVLISLAVIIIPLLLPGEGSLDGAGQGSKLPPEPDYRFSSPPEPPAEPVLSAAPAVPLGNAPALAEPSPEPQAGELKPDVVEASAPVAKPAPKSKTTQDQPVVGWVVQLGSFSNSNNARALRDKLRKQGYAAFVEEVPGDKGPVFRVRVGPELRRDLAEALQARLQKDVVLSGMVLRYP